MKPESSNLQLRFKGHSMEIGFTFFEMEMERYWTRQNICALQFQVLQSLEAELDIINLGRMAQLPTRFASGLSMGSLSFVKIGVGQRIRGASSLKHMGRTCPSLRRRTRRVHCDSLRDCREAVVRDIQDSDRQRFCAFHPESCSPAIVELGLQGAPLP